MLALLNNFISPHNDIVLDLQSKKGYLLIQKCGTQTLLHLVKTQPTRFILTNSIDFLKTGIDTLTVFVREPVDRYISGIITQMKLYQIDQKIFENLFEKQNIIPIFDSHTMPQFWFLLRFGIKSILKFEIVELDQLSQLVNTSVKLNPRQNVNIVLSDKILSKIDYTMTEDIVLYNQFLGKTTTILEIIAQISKEVNYYNECKKYKDIFSYLEKLHE